MVNIRKLIDGKVICDRHVSDTLYIHNFPDNMWPHTIYHLLRTYGTIHSLIVTSNYHNIPRYAALVIYGSVYDAMVAHDQLSRAEYYGCKLNVRYRSKRPRKRTGHVERPPMDIAEDEEEESSDL